MCGVCVVFCCSASVVATVCSMQQCQLSTVGGGMSKTPRTLKKEVGNPNQYFRYGTPSLQCFHYH